MNGVLLGPSPAWPFAAAAIGAELIMLSFVLEVAWMGSCWVLCQLLTTEDDED